MCVASNKINGNLQQEKCGDKDTLLWTAVKHGDGLIIKNKTGGVMDNNNGNKLIGNKKNNNPTQDWSIDPVYHKNYVQFRNLKGNKCADDLGKAVIGKTFHLRTCTNDDKNQWFSLAFPHVAPTSGTNNNNNNNPNNNNNNNPNNNNNNNAHHGTNSNATGIPFGWFNIVGPKGNGWFNFVGPKGNTPAHYEPKPNATGTTPRWFNIVGPNGTCSSLNNGRLVQATCSDTDDLMWTTERHGSGVMIKNKTGKVMDAGQGSKNGNDIIGNARNNTPSQIWAIEPVNNGQVHFRNPQSNKCVDDGMGYQLWNCSKTNKNQIFTLALLESLTP